MKQFASADGVGRGIGGVHGSEHSTKGSEGKAVTKNKPLPDGGSFPKIIVRHNFWKCWYNNRGILNTEAPGPPVDNMLTYVMDRLNYRKRLVSQCDTNLF